MIDAAIAKEAVTLVTGDRAEDYGDVVAQSKKVAAVWSAVFGWDVRPEQVPMAMGLLKAIRQEHSPKRDNVVDGVGYWLLQEAVVRGLRKSELEALLDI